MENLESLHLKVVGNHTIHCSGCENTVEYVLRELSGVQSVEASHRTQEIDIRYDPKKLDREQIEDELEGLNYQVEADSQ